jgi:hypothetical protein
MWENFTTWEMVSFSQKTLRNGVSKYHTENKGKREADGVLRTHARTHANILSENLRVNKNNNLQFCSMQNYIKCWFAKRQEKTTG